MGRTVRPYTQSSQAKQDLDKYQAELSTLLPQVQNLDLQNETPAQRPQRVWNQRRVAELKTLVKNTSETYQNKIGRAHV